MLRTKETPNNQKNPPAACEGGSYSILKFVSLVSLSEGNEVVSIGGYRVKSCANLFSLPLKPCRG